MRYLVTGCAGFIGSHLSERLLAAGHRVIGVDCFTDYYAREIKAQNLAKFLKHPNFTFHEVDLNSAALPELLDKADGVFHLAAQAGVRASWGKSFQVYLDLNLLALQKILEALKERGGPRLVFASSSSVYGDTDRFPTPETAGKRPLSPYGVTKLAGEALCDLYGHNYGLEIISLRFFTVFGPRQRPDMAFHRFFRALIEGQPIKIFGDGQQTRDFTYVADIVEGAVAAMERGVAGRAYNLGGGNQRQLLEVIRTLADVAGKDPILNFEAPQKGDVRDTCADNSLARKELGFEPKYDLKTGLTEEFNWIKKFILRS
jgi:nucleoside-diphosphate-sugar epimerase